jgi:hypothetical protein
VNFKFDMIMNKIIKWWKRRNFDLRQACIDKYSKEFGEKEGAEIGIMYDAINRGIPIGGLLETAAFLDMIERVKKESGLY